MAECEILYRGKRINDDSWVYGFYIHRPQPVCIGHSHPYCIWIPANNPDETTTIVEVDPATVGQFTGLVVANGKVFDGDYLKFGAYILEVFWNGETFQWQAGKVGRSYDTPFRCCGNYRGDKWTVIDLGEIAAEPIITGRMTTEIVGNRWDNPELIPKTTQYEIEF